MKDSAVKRALIVLLCVAMTVSYMPPVAFAEAAQDQKQEQEQEQVEDLEGKSMPSDMSDIADDDIDAESEYDGKRSEKGDGTEEKDPDVPKGDLGLDAKAEKNLYPYEPDVVHVDSWEALADAVQEEQNNGKTIVLADDIDASGEDYSIKVDGDDVKTITIDLASHKMDRKRKSDTGDGHAITVKDGATLTITDSSEAKTGLITGGNATDGGGIKIEEESSCIIEGGTIGGNEADKDGGGIYVWGNLQMTGGAVTGNYADDDGGGIYVEDTGHLELNKVTISDNSSKNEGGAMNVCADGSIKDCVISNNKSNDSHGGGVRFDSKGHTLTIENTKINENTADNDGGGIHIEDGHVIMTGGSISGNKASDGAGVYNPDGTIELDSVIISGNESTEYGGAGVNSKESAIIRNCGISGNTAAAGGGGLYITGKLEMSGGSVTDNMAKASGGAFEMYDCTATVSGVTMTGNTAMLYGGAVSINDSADLHLSDCDIKENTAYEGGGGIWFDKGSLGVSGAVTVTGNKASDVYINSGRKITIEAPLSSGDKKSNIGVALSSLTGVFTSGYGDVQGGDDPLDHFSAEAGCSAVMDGKEVRIVASEWGRLQHKINTAGKDEIINLDKDYKAAPEDVTLTVPEGKDLIIDLNGHTINRDLKSYKENGEVFTVNGKLRVEDSAGGGVIKGGYGGGGGAWVGPKGELTLSGGSIKENHGNVNGGGVLNEGKLTIEGGKIENNSTEKAGGAVYTTGSVILKSGLIADNTAKGNGGGIYIALGVVTMSGSNVSSNSGVNGGGVYIDKDGTLELFGGSVTSNTASSEGGGVWHGAGALKAKEDPAVVENKAEIGNNIMLRDGNVIEVIDKLTVSGGMQKSAMLDVTADNIDAVLTRGITTSGNVDIAPKVFTYNGGSYDKHLEIRDNELYHLDVKIEVWVDDWKELQDAINASENQGKIIGFEKNITAGDDDGTIELDNKNVIIELNGYELNKNRSDNKGSVFHLSEGSSLTVRDSVGSGVITGGNPNNGGGIKIEKDATCVIEGGTIRGNKVKEDGGGIYVGGTLKMLGGAVNENSADDDGGGIYVDDTGHMELSGATIAHNSAENEGGGMNVCANGSIKDCIISNNRSEDTYGGGIRLDASDVTLTIDNTDITGNSADNDGGGIQINQGKLVMNGGSISDNTADDCGGIFNDDDGSMELTGVRITGNKSTGESGGGVNNQNLAVLTKCIIKNNSADDAGGGVYNKDDLTMTDCTVESNSADGKGGGLFNKSDAKIENCTFTSNKSKDSGGGVFMSDDTSIINCTMTKNESEKYGGAVCVDDDELTLVNGSFTENTASYGGSGLYIDDHTTINGAVVVMNNKNDDVYICSGDELRLTGALKDGDKKAVIGVKLEDDTGTFTADFKKYEPDEDPANIFNAEAGYSVIRNGDGDGKLVKSEWPRLQKLINDTAKKISDGEEAPVLTIDRDWKAAGSDTMLTIPENKALIIDLNGHTIDRNRSSEDKDGHVIMVSSGSMLTIRDSSSALSGLLTGGYGTNGGGINVQSGAFLSVESGIIKGNKAVYGGGINCRDNGKVSISGGTITENDATYGGGVYIADNEASVVDITGGMITGNNATIEGGGVHVHSKGVLNVSGAPLVYGNSGPVGKNILLYQGAAVRITGTLKAESDLSGAKLDISAMNGSGDGKESKLTDGLTTSGNADNAPKIFTYNESSYDSTLEIKDDGELYHKPVTVDKWVSDWEELQDAVEKKTDGQVIGLSKDITAPDFENDSPIYISKDRANVIIELNGHKLDRSLSSPVANGSVISMEDGVDMRLTIRDSAGTGVITGGFGRNDDDAGISIIRGTCVIEGGTICGNHSVNGGGIYIARSDDAKLIMTGGSIVDNKAGENGGGIYCRYEGSFEIRNTVITGNTAKKGGGIYHASENDCKIENCRITGNKADNTGGGIYSSGDDTLWINDTEISRNNAENIGGGMSVDSGTVVMAGGSVSDNKSSDGAGVYNSGKGAGAFNSEGSIDFTGVRISGNTSTDKGGGGLNNKGIAKLTDCEITGNTADESGSGIWTNEPITITGGKISNNTTDGAGGGICIWHAEATITGSEISGNKASDEGGGVYISRNDGRLSSNDTKLTISGCTLASNKTEESGGALYSEQAEVRVTDCTITGNEAIERGAGIYISQADLDMDTELTLSSGAITDNTANQKGGGIYYAADTDELNISGPIQIHDNSGGDVYLEKRKEINVTGALTDGKTKASIGVVSENDLGDEFTDDYRKHNDQDPAEFFFSNEGYEVYLTDGEAALRKPDVVIDTEKHFIAKKDQVDKNWEKLNASNWMSGISGERYLNEINVPGSHDSCTKDMEGNVSTGEVSRYVELGGDALTALGILTLPFGGGILLGGSLYGKMVALELSGYMAKFSKTQRRYVNEQFEDGIRMIDLRVNTYYSEKGYPVNRHDNGKDLWVLHGKDKKAGSYFAKKSNGDFLNLKDVFGYCKAFLEKHPTETITVDIAIQGIDVDEDEAMDRLKKHIRTLSEELNPMTGEPYLYMEDGDYTKVLSHYPQLKDCRGKIVLMGDTVGNGTGGLKKGAGLANVFGPEGDFHDNSDQKIGNLKNFYAVYGHDPLPKDGNNGEKALDYYYSVGTNCTDDRQIPQVTPLEYADDVLPVLFDDGGLLTDRQSLYLGLVNMDNANVKNNKQVWITNFGTLDYCTVTVKSKKDDTEPKIYTVLRNTPITIPECIYNDPNEKGQYFQYWRETKGAGSEEGEYVGSYYPDDTCTIKEDVTFTAVWDPDSTSCIRAVWEDGNNADKIRPDELEVTVSGATSEGTAKTETFKVKASENWRKNLDYTVTNVVPAVPEGYTYTTRGTKITLRHKPEKTMDVSGDIKWRDDDNKEGKRPDSVKLNLFKDGERTMEQVVTSAGSWKYDFGKLQLYTDDIKRIGYYLEEDNIENYSRYVSGHTEDQGFIIINTLEKQFMIMECMMLWADDKDAAKERPKKVTVHLTANGTEVAAKEVTEDSNGDWLFSFDMDQKIPYSGYNITVDSIKDYITEVTMGDSAGDIPVILNTYYIHEHQPAELTYASKEATCEEKGSSIVYEFCSTCGKLLSTKEQTIAALGHDWGPWEITKEATDTETGLKTRVCRRDASHKETQVIPIGGHQHVLTEIPEKKATCTEDGNIRYWKCTGGDAPCGMLFSDSEGAHEIAESDTIIKALGHKWGDWVDTKPATEMEEGEQTRTCQNDESHTETRKVPKKMHVHDSKKVDAKAATCTEDGNIAYFYCTGCGWQYIDGAHPGTTWIKKGAEVIPALGHDWGEWETVKEATETEPGLEKRVCSHDNNHVETREIPVKVHEHDFKKIEAKAATCTEPGNIAYYTCEGCGWNCKDRAHPGTTWIAPGNEIIPATGHDWGEWTVTKPATETEEGQDTRTCSHDESHKETRVVPKLAHIHAPQKREAKDATCTEDGNISYYYCAECGWYFKDGAHPGTTWIKHGDEVIPALGHAWKEATCTKPKTCARCKMTEGDPKGHNWSEPVYIWSADNKTVTAARICRNNPGHLESETVNTTSETTKAATCTEKGEITYTAVFTIKHDGGFVFEKREKTVANIDALGHEWTKATCTEPQICTRCKAVGEAALGHSWKKATCTRPKTCRRCQATEGKPLGHSWKRATCTEPKTCRRCQATEGEPLGHDWKEATCTKPKTCRRCGLEEGEPLGHDWGDPVYKWGPRSSSVTARRVCKRNALHIESEVVSVSSEIIKKPTCTEKGVTKYTSETFTNKAFEQQVKTVEDIKPLGHSWKRATCTEPKTCRRCRKTDGEPLGHDWKEPVYVWGPFNLSVTAIRVCRRNESHVEMEMVPASPQVVKEATCTEPGITTYTSKAFRNKAFEQQVKTVADIKPLGHDWKDATCTEPKTCRRCQVTEGEPLGHSWKEATCTEPKTCRRCKVTEGEPLGHKWCRSLYVWADDASSVKASRICMRCAESESEEATLENNKITSKVTKAATCEKPGETTYTARFENAVFTEQVKVLRNIPATGHNWGSWHVTKKPTSLNKGEEQRVCANDSSHVETRSIPAAGVSGVLRAKLTTKGKKTLVLKWTKIKGAEGYDIFFTSCSKAGKIKKVKTVKGNKVFKWTKKKLAKGTRHKAYVKAWAMKDGRKKYVRTSPKVHAYTSGGTKKYTNARSVTVKKKSISLKRGKKYKIKAKVNKRFKKRKLMPAVHVPKVRYISSNKKIAKVSRYGTITAKKKGTCKIYVFAHNGVGKTIKLKVK